MNRNFTQEDLIRYYYDEMNAEEAQNLKAALKNDQALRQQFDTLSQTCQKLDDAFLNPSETSVDIIREHSGHFSSLETS